MTRMMKWVVAGGVGLLVLGSIFGLVLLFGGLTALQSGASVQPYPYFLTVNELTGSDGPENDRIVRVSGAVVGASIQFHEASGTTSFQIAHVPAAYDEVANLGGLAAVLEGAVTDPNSSRLEVYFVGEPPMLLRDKAQAILVGRLGQDRVFIADEILLKCPARYAEAVPDQAVSAP